MGGDGTEWILVHRSEAGSRWPPRRLSAPPPCIYPPRRLSALPPCSYPPRRPAALHCGGIRAVAEMVKRGTLTLIRINQP